MLKKLLALTLVFVGAFALTACDLTGELDDIAKLDEAIADLIVSIPDEVDEDMELPLEGLHDVVISWESANTAIIENDGTIHQPAYSEGNAMVAITATLTSGEEEYTKTFTITVLKTTVLTDLEKLSEAVPAITLPTEVGSSITLPVTGLHDVMISWESSHPWYLSETGAVTNPPKTLGDEEVTLTATFTAGEQTFTKAFVINVTAATELNNAEKVAAAKAAFDLGITSTSDDVDLPTEYMGVTLEWASSNEMYIDADGMVTNPLLTVGDQDVVLTVTFVSGLARAEMEIPLTILANTFKTDMELLEEAAAVILLTVTGNVETDFTVVAAAKTIPITWSSSDEDLATIDVTDGVVTVMVTRPENGEGNQQVVLTATLTLNDDTVTKDFTITIQEKEPVIVYTTVADIHANSVLDDLFEFTGIVTGLFNGGYFLTDGTDVIGVYFPGTTVDAAIGDEIKVVGEYGVYNTLYQVKNLQLEEKVSTGNANPLVAMEKTIAEMNLLDSTDALIHGKYYTITGTIALFGDYDNVVITDGVEHVMVYYNSPADSIAALEALVGKEVTITVYYYTDHGRDGVLVVFQGLEADITVNTLPDDEALAADKLWLEGEIPTIATATITLPAEGVNGTTFTNWQSSDVAVFGHDGVFVAKAATSTTVTFTATATAGALTETVTIEVYVPVASTIAEVLAMNNGDMFEITGVVYEESYYGIYIHADGNYIFLFGQDLAAAVEPGDELTVLGSRGIYNGLVQANIVSYTKGTTGNATVTAIPGTVEGAQNDVYPRGSIVTVTGTVTVVTGTYTDVFIDGLAGGRVKVYYRSNANDVATFDGKVVTLDIILYHNELVLFNGVAADITEETAYAATDAEKAQAAVDSVDLGDVMQVIEDLTLPSTETNTGATFAWATSDALVVTDAGVITIPYGSDAMATLTVTATVGAETATRDIMIKVLDGDMGDPLTVTEALLEADGTTVLVTGVISGWNEYGDRPFIQDTDGTALYIYAKPDVEIGDEVVVRGELATYSSYGNSVRQISGSVVIVETLSTGNTPFVITGVTPAEVADNYPANQNQLLTMDLTIKTLNDGGDVFFTGGTAMDLKMDIDAFAPYLEAVYQVGDTLTMTFIVMDINFDNVRISNVTMPALSEAQNLVAAKAVLDLASSVTDDITLPAELTEFNATISWSSDNTAVITDAGVVTRPANGVGDATVNLTATITVGASSDTKVIAVVVPEQAPPKTVTEVWDAGYSTHYADYTAVEVTGIVAALTDKGYVLQDPVTAELISVHDSTNTPSIGDQLTIQGEFNVSYDIARILNVTAYAVGTTGNTVNFDVTNAVTIDFTAFDPANYIGKLVKVEGPWVKLYSGATSYARLADNETNTGTKAFDGKYVGLQNGANENNITGTLADTFTGLDTPTEYANVTVYIFFYDSTSSYNKAVIIGDDHIVVTPAS